MKIVILDGGPSNPGDLTWDAFYALGEVTVFNGTRTPSLVLKRLAGATVAIVNKIVLDETVFSHCPDLKLVAVLATGYNTIDADAARRRGIVVCNVPDYSTYAVAQHTVALLLEICNRVGLHSESVCAGDWINAPDYSYWKSPLVELAGKTFGIIGLGNIGRRVAKIVSALGLEVVYYSRTRRPELEGESLRYLPLLELLGTSDVVSLHCPLTPETNGLINHQALAAMKSGAILLNTSRGPLLDEAAVAEALNSGQLYAAGVDVLSSEPPASDNPLLSAKNCIITPHIAWAPRGTRARLIQITYDNLCAWLAGHPQNVINP